MFDHRPKILVQPNGIALTAQELPKGIAAQA